MRGAQTRLVDVKVEFWRELGPASAVQFYLGPCGRRFGSGGRGEEVCRVLCCRLYIWVVVGDLRTCKSKGRDQWRSRDEA